MIEPLLADGEKSPIADGKTKPARNLWKIACIFIFLLSFKPSEPHLTTYLTHIKQSDGSYLSDQQVNNSIYPIWGYSYLVLLLLIAPMVEPLGYYPIIILGSLGRFIARLLLVFGTSIAAFQGAEVAYALGSVSETVFCAYIYHLVEKEHFTFVTSATQVSFLVAHVSGGLFGDFLLHVSAVSLRTLFYISAISVGLSTAVAVFGFSPKRTAIRRFGFRQVYFVLRAVFSSKVYALLSVLWVYGSCVWAFLGSYEPSLFTHHFPRLHEDYNGSVLGLAMVCGGAASLAPSWRVVKRRIENRKPIALATAWGVAMAGLGLMAWAAAVPSLGGYVVYATAWQLLQVVFYTVTALRTRETLRESDGVDVNPPYSTTFFAFTCASMLLQSAIQVVLLSWRRAGLMTLLRTLSVGGIVVGFMVLAIH